MTKWLNEGLIFGIVVIVNIVSLSSRPIQGFSSSSIVSLLQLDTLSACELAIFSACLSVSRDGRCKKREGQTFSKDDLGKSLMICGEQQYQ